MLKKLKNVYASFGNIYKKLGPGLLYAGAAVGVSHLVQSTRAGAEFGTGLIWAILLANLIKYPFYSLATRYTAHTGKSMLDGYKELGNYALYSFMILSMSTMFIIIAAIGVVTSGLLVKVTGLALDVKFMVIGLLLVSSFVLLTDKLSFLNSFIKVIVIILSVTTLVASLSSFQFAVTYNPVSFEFSNDIHFAFLIALMGWMPAPMDTSIWQSQWYVAKFEEEGKRAPISETMLDFRIGYIGTLILALLFLFLGKNMMYGKAFSFPSSSVGFAGQLIDLYTTALGKGFYYLIAIAATFTMVSTTLTCLDAFPRVLRQAFVLIDENKWNVKTNTIYRFFLGILVIGSVVIVFAFLKDMKAMVDFATIISFLMTPILAYFNYKVWQVAMPDQKMNVAYRGFCLVSLLILTLFTLVYLKDLF